MVRIRMHFVSVVHVVGHNFVWIVPKCLVVFENNPTMIFLFAFFVSLFLFYPVILIKHSPFYVHVNKTVTHLPFLALEWWCLDAQHMIYWCIYLCLFSFLFMYFWMINSCLCSFSRYIPVCLVSSDDRFDSFLEVWFLFFFSLSSRTSKNANLCYPLLDGLARVFFLSISLAFIRSFVLFPNIFLSRVEISKEIFKHKQQFVEVICSTHRLLLSKSIWWVSLFFLPVHCLFAFFSFVIKQSFSRFLLSSPSFH